MSLVHPSLPRRRGAKDLSAGNTTLPHPDADLSPNACISADDVPANRVLHRSRRSFLAKHKRTLSYGKVLPEAAEHMYSDPAAVLESEGDSSPAHEKHDPLARPNAAPSEGRPSKDSLDGRPSSSIGDDDDLLGKDLRHGPPSTPEKRRRSLLRKFRRGQ